MGKVKNYRRAKIKKGLDQGLTAVEIVKSFGRIKTQINLNDIERVKKRMRSYKQGYDSKGDLYRQCPCCKNFKLRNKDNFYTRKEDGDGLDPTCKNCRTLKNKNKRIIQKEKVREYDKQHRNKNRAMINLNQRRCYIRTKVKKLLLIN